LKELGGFGASLYGGYDFGFSQQGQQGIFWTNTEISDVSAKTVSVSNGLNGLYHIGLPKTTGCSVRCVKD
jgi:uncharacterized protein (TIGR02145 family)